MIRDYDFLACVFVLLDTRVTVEDRWILGDWHDSDRYEDVNNHLV